MVEVAPAGGGRLERPLRRRASGDPQDEAEGGGSA